MHSSRHRTLEQIQNYLLQYKIESRLLLVEDSLQVWSVAMKLVSSTFGISWEEAIQRMHGRMLLPFSINPRYKFSLGPGEAVCNEAPYFWDMIFDDLIKTHVAEIRTLGVYGEVDIEGGFYTEDSFYFFEHYNFPFVFECTSHGAGLPYADLLHYHSIYLMNFDCSEIILNSSEYNTVFLRNRMDQ
jgi:hypothetical protein